MKITKQMILNLIGLFDKHGLIHGAGSRKEEFCVQQAVNRVIHDNLYGQYEDNPGLDCMSDAIRSFGIRMNDCTDSMNKKDRAEALKRFAIAELGSNEIDGHKFFSLMGEKTGTPSNDGRYECLIDNYMSCKDQDIPRHLRLKKLADMAADVLRELGTQGGKFLDLVDEPDKDKKIEGACKLGNQIYAAQMANFGVKSCGVKPKQNN